MNRFLFLAALFASNHLIAKPVVCERCEEIREYNRLHPAPHYDYYEDYLEAQKTGKKPDEKTDEKNNNPKK